MIVLIVAGGGDSGMNSLRPKRPSKTTRRISQVMCELKSTVREIVHKAID